MCKRIFLFVEGDPYKIWNQVVTGLFDRDMPIYAVLAWSPPLTRLHRAWFPKPLPFPRSVGSHVGFYGRDSHIHSHTHTFPTLFRAINAIAFIIARQDYPLNVELRTRNGREDILIVVARRKK